MGLRNWPKNVGRGAWNRTKDTITNTGFDKRPVVNKITLNSSTGTQYSSYDMGIVLALFIFFLDAYRGFNGWDIAPLYDFSLSILITKLVTDAFVIFVLTYVVIRGALSKKSQAIVCVFTFLIYALYSNLLKDAAGMNLGFYSYFEYLFLVLFMVYVVVSKPSAKQALSMGVLCYWLVNLHSIGIISGGMGWTHVIFALMIYMVTLRRMTDDTSQAKYLLIFLMAFDLFLPSMIDKLGIGDTLIRFSIPMWWLIANVVATTKKANGFNMLTFFVLILYLIAGAVNAVGVSAGWFTSQQYLDDEGRADALERARFVLNPVQWWGKIKETFTSEINGTIYTASGQDYYQSRVDENAKKELGVYIDGFQRNTRLFYTGERVILDAVLTAENFANDEGEIEAIEVKFTCHAYKNGELMTTGIIYPLENYIIETYDVEPIECILPPITEEGSYDVRLIATFNFRTEAYLKRYFVSSELIDALRRNQKITRVEDILSLNGITETDPIAKNSIGPVQIGVSNNMPSVLEIDPQIVTKKLFSVEFENKWKGEINEITNISYYLPQGISLEECSFDMDLGNVPDNELYAGYDLFELKGSISNSKNQESIQQNCGLVIQPNQISNILNPGDVTTRFLRMSVGYEYELEEKISILVEEQE